MNISRNKTENQHMEVVDVYFSKTEDIKNFIYRGSLQDFYWKKYTHESIVVVRPYYNAENETISF